MGSSSTESIGTFNDIVDRNRKRIIFRNRLVLFILYLNAYAACDYMHAQAVKNLQAE